jgi:hypothetical protein
MKNGNFVDHLIHHEIKAAKTRKVCSNISIFIPFIQLRFHIGLCWYSKPFFCSMVTTDIDSQGPEKVEN